MRWDNLFDDLESQLEGELGSERADASRDSERARRAEQPMAAVIAESLRGSDSDSALVLWVAGAPLWITVDNHGSDWLSGQITAPSRSVGYSVVNLARVERCEIATKSTQPSARSLKRLGNVTFRIVLRDLSRRRKRGVICGVGSDISGTIDRVGKDFVEVIVWSVNLETSGKSALNRILLPLANVALFRLDD